MYKLKQPMRQDSCQLMSQHRRKTEEVVLWYSDKTLSLVGRYLNLKHTPGKATVYKVKQGTEEHFSSTVSRGNKRMQFGCH